MIFDVSCPGRTCPGRTLLNFNVCRLLTLIYAFIGDCKGYGLIGTKFPLARKKWSHYIGTLA